MKPVNKGVSPGPFAAYGNAKPQLVARLGKFCSYCEAFGEATGLDVEHIYPKQAHDTREKDWDNFLLSCTSCNSKKNTSLGRGRQRALLQRFLWPHIDNTSRAFHYLPDGRVKPGARLKPPLKKLAEATLEMLKTCTNQTKAKAFEKLGVTYSGIRIRKEKWEIAELMHVDYLANPNQARAELLAKNAISHGHFSIWMEVFKDRPEFRRELIKAFQADRKCFNMVTTKPKKKGRV